MLMNSPYDETPTKVTDVEMFEDYAAQGVIDEIPEAEARARIMTKKRRKPKRRRIEAVKEKVNIPDVKTKSGRKSRRPKRYKI